MKVSEETIEATLDSQGQLRLKHHPQLPPGPVRVTIRRVAAPSPVRGLADVIRDIAAAQRARGYYGRSAEELEAEKKMRQTEDEEREMKLNGAREAKQTGDH